MDAMYFRDHIMDELEGACDYIKRAIELKAMDLQMSKTLVDMSAAELSHANSLYEMFGKYYAKITSVYKEAPAFLEETKNFLGEEFPEKSAKILHMHEMYKK